MDFLQEYWWLFLVLWLVTKASRSVETSAKKAQEGNTSDAENLVLSVAKAVDANVGNKGVLDKILNDAASDLGDDNVYRRALVDGLVSQLEKDEVKRFTPVKGTHPLSQLASRAAEAETRKAKVARGFKRAGVVGLKILRGVLS